VPLDRRGGSLTIGYGSGGSPPLFIPSSDSEGLAFLKISFFSRPLSPLSDAQTFRSADHVPDDFKGPWATITKNVIHAPPQTPNPRLDSLKPITEFAIDRSTGRIVVSNKMHAIFSKQCLIHPPFQKPSRSIVPYDGTQNKGVDHDLSPPVGEGPARSRLAMIFKDRFALQRPKN
jgi:hypothetical protein